MLCSYTRTCVCACVSIRVCLHARLSILYCLRVVCSRSLTLARSLCRVFEQVYFELKKNTHKHTLAQFFIISMRCIRKCFIVNDNGHVIFFFDSPSYSSINAHTHTYIHACAPILCILYSTFFASVKSFGLLLLITFANGMERNVVANACICVR